MPVLEVTQLRLKGVAPDDRSLRESLSTVRGILQTQSQFYSCVEDPSLLFILGIWPSLHAHRKFLTSSRAAEILGPQDNLLEFRWTAHMELDAMASLPLQAPIIALTTRIVKSDDVDAYHEAAAQEKQAIFDSSEQNVVNGWRLDAALGTHEAVQFTGWKNAQAHAAFRARQTERDNHHTAIGTLYETLETHHAWNIERSAT